MNGSARRTAIVMLASGVALTACGGDDGPSLHVYSGRHYGVERAFERYEEATGVNVEFLTGNDGELRERIVAEGDETDADVYLTVDAGNLWAAAEEDLFQPVESDVLEASIPGFKKLRQTLELRQASDWTLDLLLQLGTVQETITVSGRRLTPAGAPRQPGTPSPVRVGGNVRPPRKLRDVRPVYSEALREAGVEGVVSLEAVIGKDGATTSVRALSARVHPELAKAAIDAVRQWRFDPTLLNGQPVEVVMTVSVEFRLSDEE